MQKLDLENCRAETLLGALIYAMTLYRRQPHAALAQSIASHLDAIARHPDVPEVVRQVGGMREEWSWGGSATAQPSATPVRPPLLN